ncbi:MAG: sel1 repeat family protein [Candidatus Thiothrix singaporensis]|uniref:Sel1 repeat family protein n=1 Tax=Candidatus Thiothrix singaporensis TaxID=2799669 RepID=A0A7L6AWR5_9GAMM|nr:MAG: sel1 repeat family protein [Candidatus Thiothrix singaporensis]
MTASDQGDAPAQFSLGLMYDQGDGVDEDNAAAVEWYRRSAEAGYEAAQHNLGNMYAQGEGIAENDALAVEWWRKAAEQGVFLPSTSWG